MERGLRGLSSENLLPTVRSLTVQTAKMAPKKRRVFWRKIKQLSLIGTRKAVFIFGET